MSDLRSARFRLARLRPPRLVGYATLLILAIGLVQLVASLLFYEAIDRRTILEDHSRRVAEMLVVSERVQGLDRDATPAVMSSRWLEVATAGAPTVIEMGAAAEVVRIHELILEWEPALAQRTLHLDAVRGTAGRRDLVGSMHLGDGAWLNFRSRDLSSGWPIALRATAMTLLITLLCLVAALYALRALVAPLQRLSDAVAAVGHGHGARLEEAGPADLRSIARQFNDMQARIHLLEDDQARSFEAISHDLRTPLSRMKIATDFISDGEIAQIVGSSADEMQAMLSSLQRFLRAQHIEATPEPVDLVAAIRTLIAPYGDRIALDAPDQAEMITYREPLLLALDPLVENALQYGEQARIALIADGSGWQVEIADDGPGIPEDCFDRILDPFFRLDAARARNTGGFGLGIPTAHRLLQRFGGKLTFRNAEAGGLVIRVTVPRGA